MKITIEFKHLPRSGKSIHFDGKKGHYLVRDPVWKTDWHLPKFLWERIP